MKKIFIAAIMAIAVSASAFAAPSTVSAKIKSRFSTEFATATNVEWKTTDTYAKASFVLNGEKVEAFYDVQGEKIGTSKAIAFTSLSKATQQSISKKFAGYNVKETINFTDAEEVCKQYVSLENDKSKVVLEISEGSVNVISREKK